MSKLFLLSRDEWELIPDEYKVPTDEVGRPDWMWLRSEFKDEYPEYRQVPMADCMMKIGNQIYFGNPIIHEGCGVRPAIEFNEKAKSIYNLLNVGSEFSFDSNPGLKWIYLGDRLAVTKNTLTYSRFDSKSTKYVGSDVYKLLASLDQKILGSDSELVNDF